jgi:hypothetical protein
LQTIENEGAKYGMRLNKNKCEYICIGQKGGTVRFADGTKVPMTEEVKYLGCVLNQYGDPNVELAERIAACMAVFNKLHLFWRHSDCSVRLKIQAYDAIIRAKLMYGLESIVFNDTHLRKLDTFHLKGLRKILKLPTTFINREYTNAFVYSEANRASRRTGTNPIITMTEFHKQRRKIMLAKLIIAAGQEPCARVTLQDSLIAPHDYGKRRVGRPRVNWVRRTLEDFWDEACQLPPATRQGTVYDPEDVQHDRLMRQLAATYNRKYRFLDTELQEQSNEEMAPTTPTQFGPYGDHEPVTPGRFGPHGDTTPVTPPRNTHH